ncbi:MAG: DNA recombination protein RmuC [bacterium]
MEILLVILLALVLLALAGMFILFSQKMEQLGNQDKNGQSLVMLQERIKELNQAMDLNIRNLNQTVDGKLTESNRQMQSQFSQSLSVIRGVTEKVTQLQETNKQVMSFTEQLKNLEKVLTNSKNRGSLGEAGLDLILQNILPPQAYEMQYRFKNGDAVDAVVKIKDNVLPVDAKFSLENYRRILDETDESKKLVLEKAFKDDLKKRIDETAKYIRPEEGTLDFAFMFIPSEGIYYDLLINEVGAVKVNTRSLIDYAFNEKKVIIVSPTTFAAYLQTVLQGLRALKIEKDAKEIQGNVEKLQKHILAYSDYFEKLGNNLGTTVNSYNLAGKELKKIDKDIVKITKSDSELEVNLLEKPSSEE